jgi:hypothetical protein
MSPNENPKGANPAGDNLPGDHASELRQILEALFEERAEAAQLKRLDELVVGDAACRRFFLEYVDLHGNLYWDAAQAEAEPVLLATPIPESRDALNPNGDAAFAVALAAGPPVLSARTPEKDTGGQAASATRRASRGQSGWIWAAIVAAACAIVAALALWPAPLVERPAPAANNLANADQTPKPAEELPGLPVGEARRAGTAESPRQDIQKTARRDSDNLGSDELPSSSPRQKSPTSSPTTSGSKVVAHPTSFVRKTATPDRDSPVKTQPEPSADEKPPAEDVIAFVDRRLTKGWKAAGIKPSPRASDSEWLRRVYLDIVGHIPPEAAVDAFLEHDTPARRSDVINRLLEEPDYARNWATIWTNLLVGRQPRARGVSRDMLEKFLRDSFGTNVPWNEVVYELVSAEGTPEQNPATNFLLAHLNNDAVPATAMTAKLFLGIQVQCTQCHDHPFQSDKQNRFWELKSFFTQTEMESGAANPAMGATDSTGTMAAVPELVTRKVGGPLYYETRRGEMRVAYPVYAGHKIDPGPSINRRRELARLIAKGNDRQAALAVVNRMWQHFFGYGFTRPVDDMGPHNPASNPEVLDRLADEFIASGYDLKQLCRWVCSTDAYQRASALRPENRSDDPATGSPAGFSHVYLKAMTAEQLYDSLLLATRAKSSARTDWNDAGRRRQDWVRQFVINYGTDENDEATVPAGSVSQALVMMNDSIVRSALAVEPGTLLDDLTHARVSNVTKIRRLCRSALSRDPRPAELNAAIEQLQAAADKAPTQKARQVAEAQTLEDIFWAFLNANEFAFVH